MNTLKSLGLGLLMVSGGVGGVGAETFRTDINPALLYYQSFLAAPQPMSDKDGDFLYSREAGNWNLPDRFGPLADGYDGQFKLVRRAACATVPCDWGIDFYDGCETQLPHLARVKAVAIAARFRTMWDLQKGREADACEDLLAAYTLTRNVSRDGTLISTLVQLGGEAIEYSAVVGNFGRFSPEGLTRLVKGFDAAPPRHTVSECVATEKAYFQDWFLRRIAEIKKANPGNEEKVIAEIRTLVSYMTDSDEQLRNRNGEETNLWTKVSQAAGGTSDGVAKLVRDLEPLNQKLTAILALPHGPYETQMDQFKLEIEKSSNPFAAVVFSPWYRARQREFRIQVRLAMIHAAVEYKLHGETGLKTVNDPCGKGPFSFRRFEFEGKDRGFELKSAYAGDGYPEVLIFVETPGPGFRGDGPHAGESLPVSNSGK